MPSIKKIFCSVDLTDHSNLVAEYTCEVARAFDAEVMVFYVAPTLTQYVGFHVPPSSIENFVGEIVVGAEKSMEEFVANNFKGIKAQGKVVTGYAAEEIVKVSEAFGADLIIMGTHGRVGLDRIVFGSVAEKVLKAANAPVMTIRPQPKKDY